MPPSGREEDVRELLEQAEQDLADRVASVVGLDVSSGESAAFAVERDHLAEQWDQLALADDVAADARDDRAEDRDKLATDRGRDPRTGIAGDDPGFADRLLSAGNRDDAAPTGSRHVTIADTPKRAGSGPLIRGAWPRPLETPTTRWC
jgi:hypothetical protein